MKKSILLLAIVALSSVVTFAQDKSKYGATEEEQTLCLEAIQIYRGFRDQDLLDLAYPAWQTAMEACPCTAAQTLYTDGAKFLKLQIKANKDDKDKANALVDSLFIVYEERIECYPSTKKYSDGKNACNVQAYMLSDKLKLRRITEDEGLEPMGEAVKCLGNLAKATFISQYYVMLYNKFEKANKEENKEMADELRTRLIIEYLDLSAACKYNIENQKKEKVQESYRLAQGNLDEIFIVVATCEEMVPVLEKMVVAEPNNMELKEKALNLMNIKDCTDTDFFLKTAEDVCAVNKTPECLFSIGIAYLKKGEKRTSLEYLEEAAEMGKDSENAERYMLRAGQVAVSLGQASKAMSYANKMIAKNSSSGDAYILKGDAAASMSNACDDGRLGRYCAYWMAVDYYAKAKSVDSSVASSASKKMSQARKGFPTKAILFDYGEQEGNSFNCGCFGTSTTIRTNG